MGTRSDDTTTTYLELGFDLWHAHAGYGGGVFLGIDACCCDTEQQGCSARGEEGHCCRFVEMG